MEKINIAEILKDCPSGMELDCTMFENVTFVRVDMSKKQFPIEIAVGGIRSKYLTKEGCFHDTILLPESKCVIFPKGKTTWEGFQRPFKDGDVITCTNSICSFVSIFKEIRTNTIFNRYVSLILNGEPQFRAEESWADFKKPRLATEEEKQKLFDAIKANGYKWNPETKTLEELIEPKFKVGDRITNGKVSIIIDHIDDNYYYEIGRSTANRLLIKNQDDWRLDKFDITTLKPFDKVLVRDNCKNSWTINLYSHYTNTNEDYHFVTAFGYYRQCIPYEGNEHLRGKTCNCNEYYKNW